MVNYYAGMTVAELEEILAKLRARLHSGTVTEVSANGIRTVRTVGARDNKIETELKRVLYALYVLLPDVWANPYASVIKRTDTHYAN